MLITEAKWILEAHGHKVRVANPPHGGEYRVTLPGRKAPEPELWTADKLRLRAQQLTETPTYDVVDGQARLAL